MTTAADDSYARELELKERRARWDREHAARKEQERMANARAELEREKDFYRTQYMKRVSTRRTSTVTTGPASCAT